jgi:hypothetical protein
MEPKAIKAQLLQAAATLAAGVIGDSGPSAAAAVAKLAPDPKLQDPDVQALNVESSQIVTVFYSWLLACWSTNGVNADGTPNAFADPVLPAPGPRPAAPTGPAPAKPA